ncbi:MAG: HlyD family efflux transporter periplasmic adaptor subunit [Phycisphaerales bacterium]|jgi:HlyD family secretion protein|nr:HlyD family efflux transporter periplasmic adaptor subunit [Phycisphaerales bacterium]
MRSLALITTVLLVSCGDDSLKSIPTAKVERMNFDVSVETIGELDAARSTIVSSSIGGDKGIIIWLIDEGTRVVAGDPLVRLDPTPFEKEVARAKATLVEVRAVAASFEQAMGWEKIQAQRQVASAEFDLRVAELDLLKFEKGDGPLELSRLESAVQVAQQNHNQFSGYLEDLQKLMNEGIITENEVLQGRRKAEETEKVLLMAEQQFEIYRDFVFPSSLEKAKGRVARSKLELEQTRKSSGFQIGKAQASMDQATQQVKDAIAYLDNATEELQATTITAPIPGMVVYREEFRSGERRKPRIGDSVWHNQPLLYLPDISSMIVETVIREVDVHKVKVGTPTTTRVDAFPTVAIVGKVVSIGVLAEKTVFRNNTAKVFQMTIELQGGVDNLRPGMTARSTILAGSIENSLCVPIAAVFVENNEAYCFVENGGDFLRTQIELGSQNDLVVEILDGLSEGQRVSLVAP